MDTSFHNWRPGNEESFSEDSDSDVVENSRTEKEKPRKIQEPVGDLSGSDHSPIHVCRKKINKPIIISDDESSDDGKKYNSSDRQTGRDPAQQKSHFNTICVLRKKTNKSIIISDDESSVDGDNRGDGLTERDPAQRKSQLDTKTSGVHINTSTPIVNKLASSCDIVPINDSLQNLKIKQANFLSLTNDYTPIINVEGNSKNPSTITTNEMKENAEVGLHQRVSSLLANFPPLSNDYTPIINVEGNSNNPSTITMNEMKENADVGLQQRVSSLLAEKKRLQFEIVKVSKEAQTAKTTIKNINMNSLPDRGTRLKMSLKEKESTLKNLEVQRWRVEAQLNKHSEYNTLKMADQKLLQQTECGFGVRTEKCVSQPPAWSKLPSSNVNEVEMGKRALETHRTQQALTLDALRRLHNSLKSCPKEDTHLDDPKGINIQLMPHQKHALAWLIWRESEIPSGGLLADDMGLGKTLTMIALILKTNEEAKMKDVNNDGDDEDERNKGEDEVECNPKKYLNGGTLVVCPATLLGHWEGEIRSRVKRGLLDVEVHHGSTREKKSARLARRDVVITTYSIVMRDCGGGKAGTGERGPLMDVRWERVILDEAHNIRNFKSQTSVAVCRLKARKRWALTGTPIQNKELDLFAQLKFLRCSPFDDIAVWRRWVDNKDAAGLQRLNTLTRSLMLRRTKEGLQCSGELTSLGNKHVQLISVHLDVHEMEVYERVSEFSQSLFTQFIWQKAEKEQLLNHGMPTSKASAYLNTLENPFVNHPELNRLHRNMKAMNWDIKSHDILVLLLRLRQLCCHPSLISSMLDKEAALQDGIEDADGLDMDLMERMNSMTLEGKDGDENEGACEQVKQILTADNPVFKPDRISSKMAAILMLMEENVLKTEDKAVVVSQWTSMLTLLYQVFKTRGVKCELLTGAVPVKNRMAIVDRFNKASSGLKVLLLSLTAGGTGLNLVGGNHLMLIDLHWNPQLEAQASDRIYRVGQTKPVKIYKFVCVDTIEERIKNLQQHKLSLAEDVLTGSVNAQTTKLSLDDLKMLFNVN